MFERDPHKAEIGVDILPFEMGYLPDIYQKKAEVELHETQESRVQYIRQLKEKLKQKPRYKDIDFSEDFLLQHLRARKFNVDRAYVNVKNFVAFTKKQPNMFSDLKYEISVRAITDKIGTVMPWRCQDGCAIMVIELENWHPDTFSIEEVKRMLMVIILQSLLDPMTQVNGFKVIIDVKTASLRHLRYCTLGNLYNLYHGTQDCAPARYKSIHVVNDSAAFKAAWFLGKHLLSEKLKQRLHFHSTRETLFDFFPRAVLPTSFGGDLENYDQSDWLKRVMGPEKLALIGGGCIKHLSNPV